VFGFFFFLNAGYAFKDHIDDSHDNAAPERRPETIND